MTSTRLLLDIEIGMPWRKGKRLKLVSEDEAPEPVHRIYSEIKEALGVPFVSTIFQASAA